MKSMTFPSLSEIQTVRKTRIATDLIAMDAAQLAQETISMIKYKYEVDDAALACLKAEISEWAHDELLALWDGCGMAFITLAPSFTDKWMERCTIRIENVLKAVTPETAKVIGNPKNKRGW